MLTVGNKEKILCDCGKLAVWCYVPGYRDGSSPYVCDDCVNRECECGHRYIDPHSYDPPLESEDHPIGIEGVDWIWVSYEKKAWQKIDEKGRPYPCCEYHYDQDGFDVYEEN